MEEDDCECLDNKSQEIAYEVEHVFNENGKEVRKMPIKMGTSTYWVDVVDKKPEVPEDGFVMDFNMDDDTSSTGSVTNTFFLFCLVIC